MVAGSVRVRRIVELVDELPAEERAELEVQLLAGMSARGELEELVLEADTIGRAHCRDTVEERLGAIAERVARVQSSQAATLSLEEVERSLRADLDFWASPARAS